jgi:two-component system response regulator HydG
VTPQVLVVDDEKEMCELIQAQLAPLGYNVIWRTSGEAALELLDTHEFDVLLTDVLMDGMSGLELCQAALAKQDALCVIVMTGFGTLERAIEAIRAGAYDFTTKPFNTDSMALRVERAVAFRRLNADLKNLRESAGVAPSSMVGSSPPMKKLRQMIDRIATTDAAVLIVGETGTGKELVARAVHERSGRKGPFVAINCAAIPEHLMESELFGYMKGAFTSAYTNRPGVFVEANTGTLFLDEIGELPLPMQAKLLRALQERTVRPLGGSQEIPFDARMVAATNADLEEEVKHKRFREDLFYRLNVVKIEVPSLRARASDILPLAHHFVQRSARRSDKEINGITQQVAERFLAHEWPGNIRELENCVERAVALARYSEITLDDIAEGMREQQPDPEDADEDGQWLSLEAMQERYIRKVISAVQGDRARAQKLLAMDKRSLLKKLDSWGL